MSKDEDLKNKVRQRQSLTERAMPIFGNDNITDKSNTSTEHNSGTLPGNTDPKDEDQAAASSATDQPEFMQMFEEKTSRKTVEETHTRQTYLIRNELIARLEKLAKKKDRGFKTHLVNYAIERVLIEIEQSGSK